MLLDRARAIAEAFRDRIAPACHAVQICGSVRREKPEVGDIEIVAVPVVYETAQSLFSDVPPVEMSELDTQLLTMVARQLVRFDGELKRNGPKYKRLVHGHGTAEQIVIDLFIAEPTNYGNLVAIRTGNAEFSRLLVTQRAFGGLMPGDLRQSGGHLWRGETRMDCPTEAAFFAALGLDVPDPRIRNSDLVPHLVQAQKVNP